MKKIYLQGSLYPLSYSVNVQQTIYGQKCLVAEWDLMKWVALLRGLLTWGN